VGRHPRLGRLAGAGATVLGPAMTTYTAVLLAATAVPGWHEAHRELPFVFARSALASAGGVRHSGWSLVSAGCPRPTARGARAGC
ncbi:MAG: polysulfide reductase, partial [Actinomycetota bacterium]|nr:polysulfide reductase [Actinomycetota bacterium]